MLLLIPLLPFVGFLINAFLGRRLPKSVSGGLACLAIIGSFVVSALSVMSARHRATRCFVEATAVHLDGVGRPAGAVRASGSITCRR